MKKIIIIIILISFTQIQLKAESIKDLEIEGISIGDSLLDFYSKSEILNFPKTTYDRGVFNVLYSKSNGIYEELGFHVKINDKKYIIHSIKGIKKFENRFQRCMRFKEEVIKEISTILPDANFDHDTVGYQDKKMKNSKAHVSEYFFPSEKGVVRLWCTQYDKNTRFTDEGSVSIGSEDYVKFFRK